MKTVELNLANDSKITVVKDKIESIKENPNPNANCWITLTSGIIRFKNNCIQQCI